MKDLSCVFAFIDLKLSHRKWLSGKDIPAETYQESDLIWDCVAWINFPARTFQLELFGEWSTKQSAKFC